MRLDERSVLNPEFPAFLKVHPDDYPQSSLALKLVLVQIMYRAAGLRARFNINGGTLQRFNETGRQGHSILVERHYLEQYWAKRRPQCIPR